MKAKTQIELITLEEGKPSFESSGQIVRKMYGDIHIFEINVGMSVSDSGGILLHDNSQLTRTTIYIYPEQLSHLRHILEIADATRGNYSPK